MATSKTSEIILGRVEYINASHFNCLSFAKASDMVNGINVRLSNMAGGYPFSFGGATWHDSETLFCVASFQMLLTSICLYKRKCSVRQVALQPNALSRTNTRDSFVVISLHSAYSGCYLLYG